MIDGETLTNRRTAAASALASRHLSRPDSRTLLLIVTGRLASYLAVAHRAVRPIEAVLVWGRNAQRSKRSRTHLSIRASRPNRLLI
ncbi:hypothetical protein [Bradyrhizobium sp. 195]|nr:hypothetical protein IVB26_08345 [Bradyrhizobium sp. 195]